MKTDVAGFVGAGDAGAGVAAGVVGAAAAAAAVGGGGVEVVLRTPDDHDAHQTHPVTSADA